MNVYEKQFVSVCPNNSQSIIYQLRVETDDKTVMVEHINTACALFSRNYHEDIANSLFNRFGGRQVLKAHHHGVDITTVRGEA